MYKISQEKCVCFILLMILAVLSCTGFRIDNLTMTDISKRNYHQEQQQQQQHPLSTNVDKLLLPYRIRHQHRLVLRTTMRHQHLQQQQQQQQNFHHHHQQQLLLVRPHVEVLVFPPTTNQPSEHLAQVPSTDPQPQQQQQHPLVVPTRPVVSRSQRSPEKRRHGGGGRGGDGGGKWSRQQEDDISVRAYKAEIVILAVAQSCNKTFSCVFKVKYAYKNNTKFKLNNRIMFQLRDVELNREYVLFLNASSTSHFKSVGAPKLVKQRKKARIEKIIKHASSPKLVTTKPRVVELKSIPRKNGKQRLQCKVKGFPVPKIIWRRNGEVLHHNDHMVIHYKRKQSRLTTRRKDADLLGKYECVAKSVDGRTASKTFEVTSRAPSPSESFSNEKKCEEELNGFCKNGATCYKEDSINEAYCICPPGYSGHTCETKAVDSSMYPQPAIYTCILGLSTKYYC